MGNAAQPSTDIRCFVLELVTVLSGSALAGFLIGTLQHYVSFGIWGDGLGRELFWFACFEGGLLGGALGVPTGLLAYYVVMKRHVTNQQIAIIVLGSLIGGCLAGVIIFWASAFVTPILTLMIAWVSGHL
jgi:tetrahydromethanopterin S-methyltransferase subunit D